MLNEFCIGIYNDAFQLDDTAIDDIDFPCCVCKHKANAPQDGECRFCDFNVNHDPYFTCAVCGDLVAGNPYHNGFYIAAATVSKVGPLCERCYSNILADAKLR